MAFISQEAREKAREIQVKADEEFAIEKVSFDFISELSEERGWQMAIRNEFKLTGFLVMNGWDGRQRSCGKKRQLSMRSSKRRGNKPK